MNGKRHLCGQKNAEEVTYSLGCFCCCGPSAGGCQKGKQTWFLVLDRNQRLVGFTLCRYCNCLHSIRNTRVVCGEKNGPMQWV